MAWYEKYLVAFERPYKDVPAEIKETVREKLIQFSPQETPLCSVVLIAHNEEKHLLGCLWSLCDNMVDFSTEIIVADNHSTDSTPQILEELGVIWFEEERKSPGFARQCGLDHARGKFHICIDTDTLYPPHYIATHVRNLQREGMACTYGLWSFLPSEGRSKMGLFFYELFRDIYLSIMNINRPELCVRGMTLAFRTDWGKQVGYRTNIIRGEDGMMANGLKKFGKLKMLRTRKARPMTSCGTLAGGGSMLRNVWSRCKKAAHTLDLLVTRQEEYEDRDYNLIKKEENNQ